MGTGGWLPVQGRASGVPPGSRREDFGVCDFRGNRQYVTTGKVITNHRVSLFLMDYAHRPRLKIFGTMRAIAADEDASPMPRLATGNYPAVVERAFLIALEAFNWDCRRAELADLLERSLRPARRRRNLRAKVRALFSAHIGPISGRENLQWEGLTERSP